MSIQAIPDYLKGRVLTAENGKSFTILTGTFYQQEKISKQHRKYLSTLRTRQLVSVTFYGQPVPLVVVENGVLRLNKIDCQGEIVVSALLISQKLGIKEARKPITFE